MQAGLNEAAVRPGAMGIVAGKEVRDRLRQADQRRSRRDHSEGWYDGRRDRDVGSRRITCSAMPKYTAAGLHWLALHQRRRGSQTDPHGMEEVENSRHRGGCRHSRFRALMFSCVQLKDVYVRLDTLRAQVFRQRKAKHTGFSPSVRTTTSVARRLHGTLCKRAGS